MMKATTQNVNRVLADGGHTRAVGHSAGFRAHGASHGAGGWMTRVAAYGVPIGDKAPLLDAYTSTLADAGFAVARTGCLLIVSGS